MAADFLAGLKQRLQRRARQLELAAGLQRDRAAEFGRRLFQRDHVFFVVDGTPAEFLRHALQQRQNTGGSFIRHRAKAIDIEGDFFVLSPNPPFGPRLLALLDIGDKFIPVLDGRLRLFVGG